jgi:Rrf2 family nitric oxide-sensitive transcriptional repressor
VKSLYGRSARSLAINCVQVAADPKRVFTTDEIARAFGISRNHLFKVVRELAAADIVAAQRGAGGGFRLARPADQITFGEVVRLLEARSALVECFRPDGGACVLTPGCRLSGRLRAAREAFMYELDRTTLAECTYPAPGTNATRPLAA